MFAAYIVLSDTNVDIITSSKDLAIRDAED